MALTLLFVLNSGALNSYCSHYLAKIVFYMYSGGSIKGRPPLLKIKFQIHLCVATTTPPPRTEKISNSAPPLMVFPGSATDVHRSYRHYEYRKCSISFIPL